MLESSLGENLMKRTIKHIARQLLGERMVGSIDYYRFPERRSAWGGPFNGQSIRLEIFKAIIASIRPKAIIETGTHIGTTTELMAESGLPVYTIESHPRCYGFARARLWWRPNVRLRQGDSRAELMKLFGGPLDSRKNLSLFFYLDAHWDEDLPLREELDIIFSRAKNAVVMIDDFQVPDDPGFSYDDYGPGKVLNAEHITAVVNARGLAVFYPAAPSHEETGFRRGCAVLCNAAVLGAELRTLSVLRPESAAFSI